MIALYKVDTCVYYLFKGTKFFFFDFITAKNVLMHRVTIKHTTLNIKAVPLFN